MRRLPLNFVRYAADPGKIMRKYHTIKIEHLDDFSDLKMLSDIGEVCQQLTVSHFVVISPDILYIISSSFKLLSKLSLIRLKIDFQERINPIVNGLTLQKIELIQTDHNVLDYLSNTQVLNLEIIDASNRSDNDSLQNFLSHQTKLENLTIENLAEGSSALFNADSSRNFSFKLKKLSTLFSHIIDVDKFDVNFISFLKLHQNNLKQMKVEGSLSPQIYKFIVANMNCIEELEMNVNELPQEISFYDHLSKSRSLQILKLNGTITKNNLIGFKGVLSHYSNIQRITIADTDGFVANDTFHLISVRLTQLTDLSVLNLHQTFIPDTIFPTLKHFSIIILNNINQWNTLITNNRSIESLNVGWIKRDQFTPEIIQEIISLPNLRHLKFGGRFIASKRIYDIIKKDYKNLRTLELMVANYEEIKNLKFVFPREKSLWLPQCLYFDEGSDREPLND